MATILIIEDDEQLREFLRLALEDEGHTVTLTQNGAEGVTRYRQSPTDLILTDIFMPEKEGLEAIMELRREFPTIKIIAMSGGSDRTSSNFYVLDLAKKFGAYRTLMKPFDVATILDVVSETLALDAEVRSKK